MIEARGGDVRKGLRNLLECAEIATEPALALEALGGAAELATLTGDFAAAASLRQKAATVTPGTDRDRALVALLTGLSATISDDHDRARSAFSEVIARAEQFDDPAAPIWAASAAQAVPGLEYAAHYNRHRPHRARNLRPPDCDDITMASTTDLTTARIRRRKVLGGLIHEYERAA